MNKIEKIINEKAMNNHLSGLIKIRFFFKILQLYWK